jgi:RimJ/RimL family protein N-acetyltransferase
MVMKGHKLENQSFRIGENSKICGNSFSLFCLTLNFAKKTQCCRFSVQSSTARRYPMSNIKVFTRLDDGTLVLIRPLQPGDRDSILEGFQRISPHSRYLRYSSARTTLTKEELDTLTCPDDGHCLALGAADLDKSSHYGIGVARYMACKDEPHTAELAIVIVDEYQGRGLGSFMLNLLISNARQNGFHTLCGYVLPENRAMLRMLRRAHAVFRYLDGGMIRADIPLLSTPSNAKKIRKPLILQATAG